MSHNGKYLPTGPMVSDEKNNEGNVLIWETKDLFLEDVKDSSKNLKPERSYKTLKGRGPLTKLCFSKNDKFLAGLY